MCLASATIFALVADVNVCRVFAEMPGEFRPKPVDHPAEQVGATGMKMQPADTLPHSRSPEAPDPLRKQVPLGKPTLRKDELILDGGWQLIEANRLKTSDRKMICAEGLDTHDWYNAIVPGTVLTSLVGNGIYPDPYYGLNNLAIPETLNKQDYWYRTVFVVPKTFTGRQLWLNFGGINYYAEIWMNGHYLGHITGAFNRGTFDVSQVARCGETNALAVMIAPPPDPGIPSEQSDKFGPGDNGGMECLDGPTFVCTEGWDWIPAIRDRDAGIWQDVVLKATGPVVLGDPQVITKLPLPDLSTAKVTVESDLHNVSASAQNGVLRGSFEGVNFEQRVVLQPGETKLVSFAPENFPQLKVKKPRLWWPNGYGKPELYHLKLEFVTSDQTISDNMESRFGIREMSYEFGAKMPDGTIKRVEFSPTEARGEKPVIDNRAASMDWRRRGNQAPTQVSVWPDQENSPALRCVNDTDEGSYLVIKVNGQKIFCNGGNWGMDDALKRISREKLEPYIHLEHDANLTMIRNWSGQSTSETFYDLCDEYGILVWNDFWMDTEGWNYSPVDHSLFLTDVADTISRYRNHPCIAIWCAQNEGVPPDEINDGNDQLVRKLDGTRYYQPNSRLVNLQTSGPWSNMSLDEYFEHLNHGFSTEMGASSVPSVDALKSMMAGPDLWPPGDAWAYHDFHSRGAGSRNELFHLIAQRYGEATNLDDFCRKAQMVNYETYRAIYEGFDSRLWNDCSGVLLWMSHPSWPSVVWQLYSWDYEPNASYFGSKKAGEPVHVQMDLPNCTIDVINHRFDPLEKASVVATIFNLSGQKVQEYQTNFTAAANARTRLFTLDWPSHGAYLVQLGLFDKKSNLIGRNFYWHSREVSDLKELASLPTVNLTGNLRYESVQNGTVIRAKVTNASKTPALSVKLSLRDAGSGKRILPAYYDDNYFSLMPGESREISIDCGPSHGKMQLELDGWNIAHSTL